MRFFEKVALLLVATLIALIVLADIGGFLLTSKLWLLALTYIVGSYWLLRAEHEPVPLAILAGFAFGLVLIILPVAIKVNQDWRYTLAFCTPNAVLFLYLLFYSYRRKLEGQEQTITKLLLYRSGILLIVSGFFISVPLYTKAHRLVIKELNPHNKFLLHNIRMYDVGDVAVEHLENGNCDDAIEAASIARREGELWLEWQQGDSLNLLRDISGTIERQYKAYACKAVADYDVKNYEASLKANIQADSILDQWIVADTSLYTEKVWSWKRMAECYTYLYDYAKSDSLYTLAIKQYSQEKKVLDADLANLYIGLCDNMVAQGYGQEAVEVLETIIKGVKQNTLPEKHKEGLLVLFKNLIVNTLRIADLVKSEIYLKEGFTMTEQGSKDYYLFQHYKGHQQLLFNNYKAATSLFTSSRQGFRKLDRASYHEQAMTEKGLFRASLLSGKFDLAEQHIKEALALTVKENGIASVEYHETLKDAALLDEMLGNYQNAVEKLLAVEHSYKAAWGESNKVMEVWVQLASVYAELDDEAAVRTTIDKALKAASEFENPTLALSDAYWLIVANTKIYQEDYITADLIYNKVLERQRGAQNKVLHAKAIVGKGVVSMAKGDLANANQNLNKAETILLNELGATSPELATVFYNKGRLELMSSNKKNADAAALKEKGILDLHYKANHPRHADNYVLLGDIAIAKSDKANANIYYNKAKAIYKLYFKEGHYKIKYLAEKTKKKELLAHL
ncbi:tetratricopeptide repeat protein [Pontibacter pudoricolor]|uniref:hypothetical protein n=1 Tax=Pontibacter pudoricolor TaxID=2694930 RepID=UPI001390FF5A|nr:hypothetical protein [Pontibacter pudoricolor]